jgi:hypothetical protein
MAFMEVMHTSPLAPSVQILLPYGALIAACLAVYCNVYGNAFLFDDVLLIKSNRFLQSWSGLGDIFTHSITAGAGMHDRFYRPLQILLYLIIYQSFGLSTVAFHLLNVGLHALNACLGFKLGIRLGFRPVAVFMGVLLWSVHPIHTEAITYISGTADPLAACFCLLGLLALKDWTRLRILYACLFFILALLSKEAAIVFAIGIQMVAARLC